MALSDGTPGSDGVLVPGEYDPRFDITTDEFEPFGFIYLITNQVNGKQYVGQTAKTTEERWQGHIKEAYSYKSSNGTRKKSNVIDVAIAKYGAENFAVEEIECCLLSVIDDREIHWIQKYDCCVLDGKEKGYNVSRGGKGFRQYLLDEKEIARLYYSGMSASELAKKFNTASDTIQSILVKNGYELRNQDEILELQRTSYGQTVLMLDDDYNVIRTFDSQGHAGDWIVEQGLSEASSKSVRVNIKAAFLSGCRGYGFYWDIKGINEDEYEKQMMKYTQSRMRSDERTRQKAQLAKTNICAYEGCTEAILPEQTYCRRHVSKIKGLAQPSNCPDNINEVVKRICETSFRETGKYYGVSDNAVRKWLKVRDIPTTVKELLAYAIEHKIIDDPINDLPHEQIYNRFISYGGLQRTANIFHCSINQVINCCLKHGMTEEEIFERNEIAKEINKPKKVARCDENKNVIEIYNSVGEASRASNVSRIQITEECIGHRSTKWHWKFLD